MRRRERKKAVSVNRTQWRRIAAAGSIACVAGLAMYALSPAPPKSPQTPDLTPKAFGEALYSSGAYAKAARTLRANYQLAPTTENQIALMKALYASGRYASVLEAAASGEGTARAVNLLRLEALIKLHRYAEARSEALEMLARNKADIEALFILARCDYALGDFASAGRQLQTVIRAQSPLSPEAWLLRARMALDDGDEALALSAAARAADAGAAKNRTNAVVIEAMIRAGRLDEAAKALATRKRLFAVEARIDAQGLYLSALLDLAGDDSIRAARAFNVIEPWLQHEIRGPLVLAAANWLAGDEAQAATQLEQYLRNTPNDWVGLDLRATFAAGGDNFAEQDAAIDALGAQRFWLGQLRAYQRRISAGDYDAAIEIIDDGGGPFDKNLLQTSTQFLFGDWAGEQAAATFFIDAIAFRRDTEQARNASALSPPDDGGSGLVARTLEATALFHDNKLEAANALLDGLLSEAPSFDRALTLRTLTDVRAGDVDEASQRLTDAMTGGDARSHVRLLLARLLVLRADDAVAVELLRPFEGALLEDADAALFYADLLRETGASSALTMFSDRARASKPEAPLTALLVEKSGRPEKAAAIFRAAFLAAPGDGARARAYGRIMEENGRAHEAAALIGRVLKRQPENAGLLAELIRLQEGLGDTQARLASLEALQAIDAAHAERLRDPVRPVAMPEDGAEALRRARQAYLGAPENGEAAFQYGILLSRGGEDASGIFRIACFWGARAACGEETPSDS